MNYYVTDGSGADFSCHTGITLLSDENGTEIYKIVISGKSDSVRIEWREPMTDHIGSWNPLAGRWRGLPQRFHEVRADSCLHRGAPVIATFRPDGTAHRTVAISDAAITGVLGYCVDDFRQNDEVAFFVELFDVPEDYSTELRIDGRRLPLPGALAAVWDWWNGSVGKAAPLPDDAFAPLYSTWYNFHQTPEQGELTKELKIAAGIGFKTVILDDGWQIAGEGTGDYRKSGDWLPAPDKFPDFKGFVDDVHSFGQKLVLWFAVPFAGFDTEAYARFKDKLLFETAWLINAGTLDIRYPEVREYISGTYMRYIKEYGIDGLKLDFIDTFAKNKDIPGYKPGMDCETVTQAVEKLLDGIIRGATAIKPDFLLEFRQNYVGPVVLKYANMLRVGDCAFDPVTNRIGVADLRMMTKDVAVHSDMLLWSPTETAENCALQLLNIMFSVLQISVRLTQIPDFQLRVLESYLDYYRKNYRILTQAPILVRHPETCYSVLSAEDPALNRRITVLYSESAVRADGSDTDVWNATGGESVALINDTCASLVITVYDCMQDEIRRINTDSPAVALDIPVGGYANIRLQ